MKKIICLAASLLALNLAPAFGQPSTVSLQPNRNQNAEIAIAGAQAEAGTKHPLTKFNLDFPGGTPADLIKAIEKATGNQLNVIIPAEGADIQLPPLKMNDVDATQLFRALETASGTITHYNGLIAHTEGKYGFETSGPPSSNSIWYFYSNPNLPSKICQFYSLAPYLDRGFTVDDVTTAIQTGWKMSGVNPPPELNYHKETKLLIAFGEPNELNTINDVLRALPTLNDQFYQKNWQETHNSILDLQQQIRVLQAKISTLATNSPEEKSGK